MLHTGVIEDFTEVRWDLRPAPQFGTIEMRICDGLSNATELAAITALTHCLVEYFSRMIDAGEALPAITPWFLAENKWRAARYGLEAIIILDADGREELVTDHLQHVLEVLAPIAADLGCASELAGVRRIIGTGGGAARQRRVAERNGGQLDAVVAHLVKEFKAGHPID